ncbi:MAG: hypothetical protein ACLGG0_15130 [Bacteriovoracia bacterium]
MRALLVLCLFFCSSTLLADEWFAPFCEELCSDCQKPLLPATPELIPQNIQLIAVLEKEAGAIQKLNDQKITEWGDFTRWLKGDPLKGSSEGMPERWQKQLLEARAILSVQSEIALSKARLQMCYRGYCSPGKRVELEDENKTLIRLRSEMLVLAPWWVSEEFAELSELNAPVSDQMLKKVLISSMTNFFQQSSALAGQANAIEIQSQATLQGIEGSTIPSQLINILSFRYSAGLDVILQRALMHGPFENRPALCAIARQKHKFDQARDHIKTGVEVGLITSSLLVGPESLLLMGVMKSGAQKGAIAWFKNLMGKAPKSSTLIPEAALASTMYLEHQEKALGCDQVAALSQLALSSEQKLQQCIEARSAAKINLILASLSPAMRLTLARVSQFAPPTAPSAITFTTRTDNSVVSVMDLARKKELNSQGLGHLSDDYWDFVGDVYRKRLNLSESEIKSFVASSRAFEPRTKLVMMTRGPPGKSPIDGGVAIVESQKATDLLPLEKATGIKLSRPEGKISEIVRLTSVSESNPHVMQDLLKEIAQVTRADPKLKKIYIYTSKVHARLYKRLGVPAKQVGEPIDRDVILEVNAEDFTRVMLSSP